VSAEGGKRVSLLEIGSKNQKILENLKPASRFRIIDFILAITLYLRCGTHTAQKPASLFWCDSRIFKDARRYSRTRPFSRIKDITSFDSKFKDNSWRSRTSGNLKQFACLCAPLCSPVWIIFYFFKFFYRLAVHLKVLMLECLHFSRTIRSLVLSIMMGLSRYSLGAVKMFCSYQCDRVQTSIL